MGEQGPGLAPTFPAETGRVSSPIRRAAKKFLAATLFHHISALICPMVPDHS